MKTQNATPPDLQKFRVHTFQIYRVSYDISAESAEKAVEIVSDGDSDLRYATGKESTGDWLPEFTVDPLLPDGIVDFKNSKLIDIRSAKELRSEALALLQQAEEMDGITPADGLAAKNSAHHPGT